MTPDNIVQAVRQELFAERDTSAFAVLDGASAPDLRMRLFTYQPEHICLYRGELAPDLAEVAPYLVCLQPDGEFTNWVLTQGWGQHWGIFALAPVDLFDLRQHFRRFLMVSDPNGKLVLFRYYDPRVLRVYLPTCNAEELATVFGPVSRFLCEDEEINIALRFQNADGTLRQEKRRLI